MDVKTNIINPSLKRCCWMLGDHSLERPEQDELRDGRRLRAPLQNASIIVFGVTVDAFSLKRPGTTVKVKSQLQMQRWIGKFAGWFNDGVQVYMIIEARKVSQTGDSVNALVFGDLCAQHASNGNAQAILARSGLIPWEVLIQGKLPPLEVRLSVRAIGRSTLSFLGMRTMLVTRSWMGNSASRSMLVSKPASLATAG